MWARVIALRTWCACSLLVLACAQQPAGTPPDAVVPEFDEPQAPPPRAVFFGSSTTAGAGASKRARRWSAIVSRRLGWIEVNRGLSGSTLTNIGRKVPSGEERWRRAFAGVQAEVVLVMYGANDVLARVPLGDPETPGTFRHACAVVLRAIRETFPGAIIVVCTPQPSRALAARRERYDLALAEAAAGAGALFVAAGAAFPEEQIGAFSVDRLHLNDAGHAALAELVLERLAMNEARLLRVRGARRAGAR